MAKKRINKFSEFDRTQPKPKKSVQLPVKPTKQSSRTTHKQIWSRAENVKKKANAETELGKKIRAMLFDMTKETKYKEKNFQKSVKSGNIFTKSEIRTSLSMAKKKATVNARKQYKRLLITQKKRKIKTTSWKNFKIANPHLINPLSGFDSADIESFYDS